MISLAEVPLFSQIPEEQLGRLRPYVARREYGPGELIVLEGDPCRDLYFVAEGVVRLRHLSWEGREYVLGYLTVGDCLDLVPALDGGTMLSNADALVQTTLHAVPCVRFKDLMHSSPELSESVAVALAERTRSLNYMVRDLALYSVRARLARFLLEHAEEQSPRQRWTQAAIAASIGSVRDVVGRTLRTFADEGLIRREYGRLRIVDRARLEEIANQE